MLPDCVKRKCHSHLSHLALPLGLMFHPLQSMHIFPTKSLKLYFDPLESSSKSIPDLSGHLMKKIVYTVHIVQMTATDNVYIAVYHLSRQFFHAHALTPAFIKNPTVESALPCMWVISHLINWGHSLLEVTSTSSFLFNVGCKKYHLRCKNSNF